MKGEWVKKSIGDVAEVVAGQSPEGSFYNTTGNGLPFYQGKKEFGERFIGPPTTWTSRTTKVAFEGDVLMSVRAPVGPVNFATEKSCIGRGLAAIRSGSSLDKIFLFYFLLSEQDEISGTEGAVFASINKAEIQKITIPIPPLPEQKRLVGLLDEAFERISIVKANADKNLHYSRTLFDSYLDGVFANPGEGWEICSLEKYIKFIDYRGHTPPKKESGMRLITAKNVKNGYLQRKPEEFVDPWIYDKWMVRGFPKKGDVLFTTEAPLANIAQLDTDEKVLFAQRIIILQPQVEKLDQTFLKYLLFSRPIKARIFSKGTGATVLGIKARLLKKIEIYFPDTLSEQNAIVTKLDSLLVETQRLESLYQRKIAALDELKKSLLYHAFKGEL